MMSFMLTSFLYGQIVTHEYEKGGERFWLIYHEGVELHPSNLVVFLHGYGANNPGSYGGWILDIVARGNVVLFPKFQLGLWYPATRKFQHRADRAIRQSVKILKEEKGLDITNLTFVTHSIGGVMASNLADQYGKSGEYEVGGLVLVQPGFKYLRLGKQPSYENIEKNTRILMITGTRDRAAGDKFAKYLHARTPKVESKNKHYFRLHRSLHEGKKINPGHKDPVAPDPSLDTGNKNMVIRGSYWFCKIDAADRLVYWRLSEALIQSVNEGGDFYPQSVLQRARSSPTAENSIRICDIHGL